MRQTRNYKERIMELQTQLNRKLENVIQEESEKLRAGLASMVPRALEVLNTSLSDSEGQIALRAAQEILDRDGRMPKVSRIQTSIETENPLGDVDADTVNEFKDKGFKEYVQ